MPPTSKPEVKSDETVKWSCFDHPTLENGYYEMATGSGHVIKPHCHPGFRLVEGEDRVCNEAEQRFMGKEPRCEDIDECLMEEGVDAIASSATSEDDEETDEDNDFQECHQEAECQNTVGSYKCVCRQGFHGNGFICKTKAEEKCYVPEPPSFGVIFPINPTHIRVLCHPDYSIHGRSVIKCDGGWWEPLPKCIRGWKSCGDPGVPKNGYRKGNRYHEGASVRFYCRQGYQLQGSRLRMCVDSELKWTGTQPHCIEITKERKEDGGEIPSKPKILHREKRI